MAHQPLKEVADEQRQPVLGAGGIVRSEGKGKSDTPLGERDRASRLGKAPRPYGRAYMFLYMFMFISSCIFVYMCWAARCLLACMFVFVWLLHVRMWPFWGQHSAVHRVPLCLPTNVVLVVFHGQLRANILAGWSTALRSGMVRARYALNCENDKSRDRFLQEGPLAFGHPQGLPRVRVRLDAAVGLHHYC